MVGSSKRAVYAALFGNLGISIAKLIAALLTGSSAMWSETYHSFSDTFNQVLLLIGIKTSSKVPTERHPFGFGKEQFFWSFIVATLLFGISGILSFEKGFTSIYDPIHQIVNTNVSYVILLISAIFEGNALRIAFNLFRHTIEARGEKVNLHKLFTEFQESKDPTILTVIVEDSAALLGIAIAAIGIYLSDVTNNMIYDAISSILIGAVLMLFAFFLAKENRALLIGEAMSKKDRVKIIDSVLKIPEVNRVITLRTMHFGPNDVLVAMEVSIVDNINTDQIEQVIDTIEERIKSVLNIGTSSKIYVEVERDSCPVNSKNYQSHKKK
ncbi:MAG: cation transporter [Thaumarchaeota archaeon]|nr:MAG: cation transporter [Nitrososphaerota archaeon]TLX90237.1 MAG: cation transporter [Nitrososphaerota archaeon]